MKVYERSMNGTYRILQMACILWHMCYYVVVINEDHIVPY